MLSEKQGCLKANKTFDYPDVIKSSHKRYNLATVTNSFLDLQHQKQAQAAVPYANGKLFSFSTTSFTWLLFHCAFSRLCFIHGLLSLLDISPSLDLVFYMGSCLIWSISWMAISYQVKEKSK